MDVGVPRKLYGVDTEIPEDEYMVPGHRACPGCGSIHAVRWALKILGSKTIQVTSASCWSGISGALKIPYTHCAFETAGAWASGVRAGLDVLGDRETTVLAVAGDGGTFDIGLQSLSGAAERNENFIYICNDNEGYMNTGIQRSSATPQWTWTTTTPHHAAKMQPKKDIDAIMAAHKIPYLATVSPGYPKDMVHKLHQAKNFGGLRFIHVLAPCPTGWRFPPNLTAKIGRLSVESRLFPLYEVINGQEYHVQNPKRRVALREYLREQGRFSLLTEDQVSCMEEAVNASWDQLLLKASKVVEVDF